MVAVAVVDADSAASGAVLVVLAAVSAVVVVVVVVATEGAAAPVDGGEAETALEESFLAKMERSGDCTGDEGLFGGEASAGLGSLKLTRRATTKNQK